MATRIARVLMAIVIAASPLSAQAGKAAPAPPPPRSIPELEARIRTILDSTHTPGVALTIVTRDSVLYAGGLGLANVAAKVPATGKTLFRIGSTSKAFT